MATAILNCAGITTVLLCLCSSASPFQQPSEQNGRVPDPAVQHYARAKDSKWYAKQLVPLRQELVEIDKQIAAMRQASKDGRGTTGAVALDKAPDGVTAEAQLLLFRQRRTQVVQRIADIEDEARENDLEPGAIRAEEAMQENGAADTNDDPVSSPEIAAIEQSIREEKEHLGRANNEADLLKRKLDLDAHTIYSNPNYSSRQAGNAKLSAERNQIAEKQDEIQQAEQKIADLEEHLEDLKLNSPHQTTEATADATSSTLRTEEKGETYWRKQFGEIRYKIRTAQSELDVLQRELNEAVMIYDPNPQKAVRENVTRKNINAHRKAIEDKKKELAELQRGFSDLEDELRHAAGDPGWSRE